MNLLSHKTGGFTLIELIVSMAVLAFLSMAFLRQSEITVQRQKQERFINGVETVLSSLRTIRTDAITSRVAVLDEDGNPAVPEGGYGVNIELITNKIHVTEFIDTQDIDSTGNPDREFTTELGVPLDQVVNEYTLDTFWGTSLVNPYPDTIPSLSEDTLTVIFLPPSADMIINDNDADHDLSNIELLFQYGAIQRRVCLNRVSRFLEAIINDSCS